MNQKKEHNRQENQIISPLANEKTYGERRYAQLFDWGLNYWTNLLASAGFSQWAEHSVRPFRLPGLMKQAASPRDLLQNLAGWLRNHDPIFQWFAKGIRSEMAGKAEHEITAAIYNRSMARARSLTLLVPGFFVMIPSVWLGAKVKPALVEWWNKGHYGEEAMDDPSLKARHAAIAAEARPTLFGAVLARLGTVVAAQATAQAFGSDKNWLQKAGLKNFRGVDPITENIGTRLGGAMPQGLQQRFNRTAQGWGYDWSLDQRANTASLGLNVSGAYSNATQDLGRFIVADTVYTAVTALTIRPLMRVLPKLPIIGRWVSSTPKVAAGTPTLEGDKIKVPANRYTDVAEEAQSPSIPDPVTLNAENSKPSTKVEKIHTREMLTHAAPHQLVGAGA